MCAMMLASCSAGAQGAASDTVVPPAAGHLPTLADMLELRAFSQLAVSADGRWVAYVVGAAIPMHGAPQVATSPDSSDAARIVLLDLQTQRRVEVRTAGAPRLLRWSPTGATLAFLVASRGRASIWQYTPTDSVQDARPVATPDYVGGSIVAFAWSSTSDTIAYLAAEPQVHGRMENTENAPPRLVVFHDAPGDYTEPTSRGYAKDTTGAYVATVVPGRNSAQVLVRHLVSSEIRPEIDWSPRGALLVSGSPIGAGYWDKLTRRVLYTLDPRTGALHRLLPADMARTVPSWSPTGRWIAYLQAQFHSDSGPASIHALQVESDDGEHTVLALSPASDGLTTAFRPLWGADDGHLFIARYQRGTARLYMVDVPSRAWRALTPDTLSVSRYALSRDESVLVVVLENANQPPELFRVDVRSRELTKLTHEADALPAMRLGHVDQISWRSKDDRFTIHGFLVKPPNYRATRRYPLVIQLHGGPGAQYTNTFAGINFASQIIPPQLLAAAGYLVLLPNPRGDPSYGPAFQQAIRGDWGPGPFGDIDAGVTAMIERGLVDSNAVGIAGHSYGGYLTAYAITHTSRIAAASINDGPVNLVSEYGQNYATHALSDRWYFGGTPWTRPDIYAAQSPITHITRVRTPVLLRYGGRSSTQDAIRQSYMLAQGFELYAALSDCDVPVQFVLHPEQGHIIDDWSLYQDWVLRNLRWFDYWLRHRGRNPLGDR